MLDESPDAHLPFHIEQALPVLFLLLRRSLPLATILHDGAEIGVA